MLKPIYKMNTDDRVIYGGTGLEIWGFKKVPMKKILQESEFKKCCLEKGVTYTKQLWNRYMDKCWEELEIELEF